MLIEIGNCNVSPFPGKGQGNGPGNGSTAPREPRRPKPAPRDTAPLRAEVSRCEARVAKIEEVLRTVDAQIADPALYDRAPAEMEKWLKKRAELADGLARAEALWLEAVERLESAGSR